MPESRGGARPGAGRKGSAIKYKTAIQRAEKRFADRLPELADNALALAFGVWAEEMTDDGMRRVYREPPDLKAIVYCLDRIMGKPRQSLEHSGPEGGPLKVLVEYAPDHDPATPAPPGSGEDPEGDAAL